MLIYYVIFKVSVFESKEETEKIRREIDSLVYAVLKEEAESESDEPGEFGTEGESGEPGESQAQVKPDES